MGGTLPIIVCHPLARTRWLKGSALVACRKPLALDDLPAEVRGLILSMLTVQALGRLAVTSREWCSQTSAPSVWRHQLQCAFPKSEVARREAAAAAHGEDSAALATGGQHPREAYKAEVHKVKAAAQRKREEEEARRRRAGK